MFCPTGGFTGWVMLSSLVMHRLDSETGYLTKMCGAGEAWTNDDAARYFGAETFKMMMDNMTAIFVKHFSPQALAVLKMLNIYTERRKLKLFMLKAVRYIYRIGCYV